MIAICEYDTNVAVPTAPPDDEGWIRQWHGLYMLAESFSQESWQGHAQLFAGPSYPAHALEAFALISILRRFPGLDRFHFVELGSGRSPWCLTVASVVANRLFETRIGDYFALAVEAEPHHYIWSALHFLRQNIHGEVVHGAAGRSRGTCRFKADTDPAAHMGQAVRPDGNIVVECYTIEDLMRAHGLARVHAVHMDIQGEEVNAVIGAQSSLDAIDFFIIGTHGSQIESELKRLLGRTHRLVLELPRGGSLHLAGIDRPFVSVDDGVHVYQREALCRET